MEEKKKTIAVRIDIELYDLLQKIKKPVEDFSWGAVRISDTEASRVLARKIKEYNLV